MIMMMRMWQDHFVLLIPPPMTNIMRIQFNQSESQLDRTSWFVSIDVFDQERRTKGRERERKIFHFLLSMEIELICSALLLSQFCSGLEIVHRLASNERRRKSEWARHTQREGPHVSWMNTNEHPRENLIITYFNFFLFILSLTISVCICWEKIDRSSSGNGLGFLITRGAE